MVVFRVKRSPPGVGRATQHRGNCAGRALHLTTLFSSDLAGGGARRDVELEGAKLCDAKRRADLRLNSINGCDGVPCAGRDVWGVRRALRRRICRLDLELCWATSATGVRE